MARRQHARLYISKTPARTTLFKPSPVKRCETHKNPTKTNSNLNNFLPQ